MTFDPVMAEIRFGVGLSPDRAPPGSVDDMLTVLAGPDRMARAWPIARFAAAEPSFASIRAAALAVRDAPDAEAEARAMAHRDQLRENGREMYAANLATEVARTVDTTDGMRERLNRFWADHFTVRAVSGAVRHLVSPYIEEAIRPHVTGRFADMLRAVIVSPMMLLYLDQHLSLGPNSEAARKQGRGLNENLARELLELHTLGVGGAYTQTDVRELAELLTGLGWSARRGFRFRPNSAEPGAETVLGVDYGGGAPSLDDILDAMEGLALHPDTARHLARKLAVHFIAPDPDPMLVETMAARYLAANGDLLAMVEGMLLHPAAWSPPARNVKLPFDYIASGLRALAVPPEVVAGASLQQVRQVVQFPMRVMGQTWQAPTGPDGWPEAAEEWITPQGMAGRISWAMQAPERLVDALPDPRDFVHHALGPEPPEPVAFAARAAETRSDGVGVILASAAFHRR